MASYKDYKSISAAQKAGSIYYTNKAGKKMLAVTKEQLDAWKKKNKGKYKGSALTAWANAKGKNISGAPSSSMKPRIRPGSGAIDVMTNAEKKEVALANKEMSNAELKRVAENALTRVEAEEKTKKYYKNQKKNTPKATKFESWYDKNKDEYSSRARAMEAYKMGEGKTESTRYGNSRGGMTDFRKTGMFYGGLANRKGK